MEKRSKSTFTLVDLAEQCLSDKNTNRSPEQQRFLHILEMWENGTFVTGRGK